MAIPTAAHEFWLQPDRFTVREGEAVKVAVLVGDAADVKPWMFSWDKLHSFRSDGPEGLTDHQAAIATLEDRAPLDASIRWRRSGTYVLALETYHASIELPAAKFNPYIIEEGLTAAIQQRRRTGTAAKPGREIYSRRAKALIQVGGTVTDDILRPLGQTLEIVPERNPYAPGSDIRLPFQIMFEGRPLGGALVQLTQLGTGKKPLQHGLSSNDGRIAFDVPRRGNWMISVVWTRVMKANPAADYDTIFSSLTFGYSDAPPLP